MGFHTRKPKKNSPGHAFLVHHPMPASEERLEQGFNSLDAQHEACDAYILSQKALGWKAVATRYDDGGFSGGKIERPAMQRLLADITAKRVRVVVVYKEDRLTRSLADFAKLVELFDAHGVSFVSVTQQFNTTSSMGRLTLNVLLSFAQFEREVTGERIRDKIAASKRKGMWMGGIPPVGYKSHERTLVIDEPEAERIREIYRLYLALGCVRRLKAELDRLGWLTTTRKTKRLGATGGRPFSHGHLYGLLSNPVYIGQIVHKETVSAGQHPAILDQALWQAVQEKIKCNRHNHRSRASATEPSLLTGLLFDDQGQRLSPTHTKKGAKRYRYYVSQALLVADREANPEWLRLPAQELENAVLKALDGVLRDELRLLAWMENVEADEVRRRLGLATRLADLLHTGNTAERISVLQRLLNRIIVGTQCLVIKVHSDAIWRAADEQDAALPMPDERSLALIEVPVVLRRCGMATRLIVRVPSQSEIRNHDPKLVALLAKAYDWFGRLTSGRCNSLQEIAGAEGVSSPYVRRVIYLAFLAPDIVQQIVRGEHPIELSADRLIRQGPFPLDWKEQRVLLRMDSA